jgi:hypothetical protein
MTERFIAAEWGWSDETNYQWCVEDSSQPCEYRNGEMILLCRNETEANIIAKALNNYASEEDFND